jgi:hypothetical protein
MNHEWAVAEDRQPHDGVGQHRSTRPGLRDCPAAGEEQPGAYGSANRDHAQLSGIYAPMKISF